MNEAWVPEFEGQRPPFKPGNTAAVVHGARSPRIVSAAAAELLPAFTQAHPQLVAEFPDIVEEYLEARVRARLLRRHLADVGLLDRKGRLNDSALRHVRWAEQHALRLAEALGLTPASRMSLEVNIGSAALMRESLDRMQQVGGRLVPAEPVPQVPDE